MLSDQWEIRLCGIRQSTGQKIEFNRRYKNANQSTGTVKRRLEDHKVNAYGSGAVGMRRRIYHQYEVEFQADGGIFGVILAALIIVLKVNGRI